MLNFSEIFSIEVPTGLPHKKYVVYEVSPLAVA
jgi:hypothetical protein